MIYISAKEAADQLGVTSKRIRDFLNAGRVEGAELVPVEVLQWRIPTPVKIKPIRKSGPAGVAERTQETKGDKEREKAKPHSDLDTIDLEHDQGLLDLKDPFDPYDTEALRWLRH